LNVWIGFGLTALATVILFAPIIAVFVLSFPYQQDAGGHSSFAVMLILAVTSIYWLWIIFRFFFPTLFKLINIANEVLWRGGRLTVREVIGLIRRGVLRILPHVNQA
jgi:hypothetical protein